MKLLENYGEQGSTLLDALQSLKYICKSSRCYLDSSTSIVPQCKYMGKDISGKNVCRVREKISDVLDIYTLDAVYPFLWQVDCTKHSYLKGNKLTILSTGINIDMAKVYNLAFISVPLKIQGDKQQERGHE